MLPAASPSIISVATMSHVSAGAVDFDFNSLLRNHSCAKAEWSERELANMLYDWADRFNTQFSLNLTTPAIGLAKLPSRTMGHYRPVPNAFGIDDEVVISLRYLDLPFAETLDTLLHEMLHQWQHHHGHPSKNAHHNDEFRAKAMELGIPTDKRGHSSGVVAESPFDQLLQEMGVETVTGIKVPGSKPKGPGSKLKKWSCGCTNVRCAVELHAHCDRCGKRFERAEPVKTAAS